MVDEIAGQLAAHVGVDPEFMAPAAQQRFHLRVALEALRHARHLTADLARAPEIPVALQIIAVALQLLPPFHELVGTLERIGADFGLKLHRAHSCLTATFCRFADKLRAVLEGRAQIG
jgi:hypothetical protein